MWYKVTASLEGRLSMEGYFPASSREEAVKKVLAIESKTSRNYVALFADKTREYPTLVFNLDKLVALSLLEDGEQ